MPDTILKLRISGEGITRWGLAQVQGREGMDDAENAISCLHDALLAVAKGMLTPQQVRDFFWARDLDEAKFHGGVLAFDEEDATSPEPTEQLARSATIQAALLALEPLK